jgi:glyoxylase-like metal-dependent hydrolase (beta-lactamase superfamily II)
LGYSGHCLASSEHAVKGDEKGKIKFHALWALIEHPSEGLILFDTGYTDRFHDATKYWPNKIYAKMTPVTISKEDELVSQLAKIGHSPKDISIIIVSHFHADHVGGLKDFPDSTIITSIKAMQHTLNTPRWLGFAKGILHDLLPKDINNRLSLLENDYKKINNKFLGNGWDLFGDDSMKIFNLPGHAAGQTGLLLQTQTGPCFLVADACWDIRAIEDGKLPHSIVKLFFDDWSAYKVTINNLQKFWEHHPDVKIIPTHCSRTTDPIINQ